MQKYLLLKYFKLVINRVVREGEIFPEYMGHSLQIGQFGSFKIQIYKLSNE